MNNKGREGEREKGWEKKIKKSIILNVQVCIRKVKQMKTSIKWEIRKLALYSYLDGIENFARLWVEINSSLEEAKRTVKYYEKCLREIEEYFEQEKKIWKKKKQAR